LDINIEDVIDMQKWGKLNREELKEVITFIDWMAHKAKRRSDKLN